MNSLALIIINDGNGDQCGYSYQDRLRRDPDGSELAWRAMVCAAEQWHRDHGGEPHSIAYEQAAVEEVRAYYRRHLEELE